MSHFGSEYNISTDLSAKKVNGFDLKHPSRSFYDQVAGDFYREITTCDEVYQRDLGKLLDDPAPILSAAIV